jgi:hypothetical protein
VPSALDTFAEVPGAVEAVEYPPAMGRLAAHPALMRAKWSEACGRDGGAAIGGATLERFRWAHTVSKGPGAAAARVRLSRREAARAGHGHVPFQTLSAAMQFPTPPSSTTTTVCPACNTSQMHFPSLSSPAPSPLRPQCVMSRTFGNAAPGGGIGVRMMVPLIDVSCPARCPCGQPRHVAGPEAFLLAAGSSEGSMQSAMAAGSPQGRVWKGACF